MAIEKTNRTNRVREALGRIYEEQHSPLFREYLRRYREDPTSRVFAPLADAYRQSGRLEEAIRICRKGLEHHPDFHSGRVALARCLMEQKRFDEAREQLEKVVRALPENLLAQRLLAEAYVALGSLSDAAHRYRIALALAPNDVVLLDRLHDLEKQHQGAGVQPILSLQDAHEKHEEVPEVVELADWDQEILNSLREKEEEEAEKNFEQDSERERVLGLLGAEMEPNDDSFRVEHVSKVFSDESPLQKGEIATETLGNLYFQQGQYDRALKIFERILAASPSASIQKKIEACRLRLGVDPAQIVRQKKVELLQTLLSKVKSARA